MLRIDNDIYDKNTNMILTAIQSLEKASVMADKIPGMYAAEWLSAIRTTVKIYSKYVIDCTKKNIKTIEFNVWLYKNKHVIKISQQNIPEDILSPVINEYVKILMD